MRGHSAESQRHQHQQITDDDKDKFLDLIGNGYTRREAADALGHTARKFRALCSPKSENYDENFARIYADMTEKGGEQEEGIVERLQAAGIERALKSSDRLLEKYSVIYDPAWHVHRPQATNLLNVGNVEQLAVMLPELSDEALLELKMKRDAKKAQKELPPAHPDIDQ